MKRHTVDVGIAAIMWLAVLTIREGRSRVPISKTDRCASSSGVNRAGTHKTAFLLEAIS
jgi:hypothetical protein